MVANAGSFAMTREATASVRQSKRSIILMLRDGDGDAIHAD